MMGRRKKQTNVNQTDNNAMEALSGNLAPISYLNNLE